MTTRSAPPTPTGEPAPDPPVRAFAGAAAGSPARGCAGARVGLDTVRFARLMRDGSVDELLAAAVLGAGEELGWVLADRSYPLRLAAALAAKEAAVKCAGGRWPGFRWPALRFIPDPTGDRGDPGGHVDSGGHVDPGGLSDSDGVGACGGPGGPAGPGGPGGPGGFGGAAGCGCAWRARQILAGLHGGSPRMARVHSPALRACPAWADRSAGTPAVWTVTGEFAVALVIGVPRAAEARR